MEKFTVITDHKNLEYFMSLRKLNERQVRWSTYMNQYNMEMIYQPGKDNQRANILSQKEQDVPSGENKRIQKREF